MCIHDMNLEEKIQVAETTQDVNILSNLMKDVSVSVRRAVARNFASTPEILKVLVYDPVMNVSFYASKHKNCSISRTFSSDCDHPCVNCDKKESTKECSHCENLKDYNF